MDYQRKCEDSQDGNCFSVGGKNIVLITGLKWIHGQTSKTYKHVHVYIHKWASTLWREFVVGNICYPILNNCQVAVSRKIKHIFVLKQNNMKRVFAIFYKETH